MSLPPPRVADRTASAFAEFAGERGVKVIIDQGLCIAREKLIDGQIYARCLEVSENLPLAHKSDWQKEIARLDREFASLLAFHGKIPLPEEFR